MPPRLYGLGHPMLRPRTHFALPRRVESCRSPRHGFRRNASSASEKAMEEALKRWANRATYILAGVTAWYLDRVIAYVTDTRRGYQQWGQRYLVVPALRFLCPDAETAHHVGNAALKALWTVNLHPREGADADARGDLSVEIFGHRLANPIGISAGLDKNAKIVGPLLALGPAIVEVGGVTPQPQEGNPRPRVFRLPSQRAIINRYGLNSEGADAVAARLQKRLSSYEFWKPHPTPDWDRLVGKEPAGEVPPGSLVPGKLLAVQIAKNKTTPDDDLDAVRGDYVQCVEKLGRYADILVVNVSSPNTPGLRDLQRAAPLTAILAGVVGAAARVERRPRPRVMVKVSPDEDSDEQVRGVCAAVSAAGVDGVIVGNTTTRRPEAAPGTKWSAKETRLLQEKGGYSGPQLFEHTVDLVRRYRTALDHGAVTWDEKKGGAAYKVIFASGGITNGKEAREVLEAGASVAMVYTALAYGGAGTITRIKKEMREDKAQS